MLLHEQLAARERAVNLKILATDVHRASLEVGERRVLHAGAARRRQRRTAATASSRKKAQGYQISQELRQSIVFAPHNLIRDAPFTKLDLITCRNLLIYFQPQAQKTVLTLFHFGLKPGGFLFLGSSESPGGLVDEFDTIDEHWPRSTASGAMSRCRADFKLPLARGSVLTIPAPTAWRGHAGSPQLLVLDYDRLLDRFMPPSFLVDRGRTARRLLRRRRSDAQAQAAPPVHQPARSAR